MIISHRYRLIFVKSSKVAGTSIEAFLSDVCGPDDVVTPLWHPERGHVPRNYQGRFNPLPELVRKASEEHRLHHLGLPWMVHQLAGGQKFHEGMPAWEIRSRVPAHMWEDYFTFTVERNPWDKCVSRYFHSKAVFEPKYGRPLTFADWFSHLRRRLDRPWSTRAWGSEAPYNYPRYADPWTDEVLVDRICRYETLETDLAEVFERAEVPFHGLDGYRAKTQYRSDQRPYQELLCAPYVDAIADVFAKEIALLAYEFGS